MNRSRRRRERGQTLIIFALGFALFLFALVCLVADAAVLFRWSGQVEAAAQLAAQSGADSVDPRYLYGLSTCGPVQTCATTIVDISGEDRTGTLFAFQRACIQAGDQSAAVPRDPPADMSPKSVADPQTPEGTDCRSDGCRVYALVTRVVQLPIPVPGFPQSVTVRGSAYAAPVVGTTGARFTCSGSAWVPQPP